MTVLLERDGELEQIASLARAVSAGRGGVLLIEGPAGIGKTSLMEAAGAAARRHGLEVLTARGAELESELAFGVVLQLFERRLARATPEDREALLAGAAALARPVFDPAATGERSSLAALHGLHWLCLNLAERTPLLLCVDDLQWCDEESLRWLAYAIHRLEDVPVGFVLAMRPVAVEGIGALVAALAAEPTVERHALAPLSEAGTSAVVSEVLGDTASGFVTACQAATGGNPLLVRELARTLGEDGIAPVDENARAVARIAPETVAHAVLIRLGRLAPDAVRLARAAAVLGASAPPAVVAQLAGLDGEHAPALIAVLHTAAIFTEGPGLEFAHPLVRNAVYMDLPEAVRDGMHRRAADLLSASGADPQQVARHVLLTTARDPEDAGTLRRAADAAARRGAPHAAVRYLRRALADAKPAARPALLHELGMLEVEVADPHGLDDLRTVVESDAAPQLRGRAALALVGQLVFSGRGHEAAPLLDDALLDAVDEDLSLRLRAIMAPVNFILQGMRDAWLRDLAPPPGNTLGERDVLGAMCLTAGTADEAIALGEAALGGGRLLEGQLPDHSTLWFVVSRLGYCEHYDVIDPVLEAALADAVRRASPFDMGRFRYLRAFADERRGRLDGVLDDIHDLFEVGTEAGIATWKEGVAASLALLLEAARKRAAWDVGDAAIERWGLDTTELGITGLVLRAARARYDLARGRSGDAIATLRELAPLAELQPTFDLLYLGVRETLGPLLAAGGERDHAEQLASALDAAARAWGTPRAIGLAVLTRGLVAGGAAGIDLLTEARGVLAGARAPYDEARALVELGAALRRDNRRADARAPLREGLDGAVRCGALALAARAEEELRATGARPRRLVVSGVAALTASELRVARMASEGLSNRDIAQALFVTRKTVERHLSSVYLKLDISSRAQLPTALSSSESS